LEVINSFVATVVTIENICVASGLFKIVIEIVCFEIIVNFNWIVSSVITVAVVEGVSHVIRRVCARIRARIAAFIKFD
jgi:hypothetical protein